MKRSTINAIMRDAIRFLNECKFFLPKFGYWTIDDWQSKGEEVRDIIRNQMGWDITDFGSGDFSKLGLILFTIRNGNLEDLEKGGKNYSEKIIILDEGQQIPMHYHYKKGEDIINRAGGELVVQVYNRTEDNKLDGTRVTVSIDGVKRTVEAGTAITLTTGESVYLPSYLYHKFWVSEGTGKLLIGEVSSVNDDRVDNHFLQEVGRFPEVEEDEEPLHLLYSDYMTFLDI